MLGIEQPSSIIDTLSNTTWLAVLNMAIAEAEFNVTIE
jgi:hypothetical protein